MKHANVYGSFCVKNVLLLRFSSYLCTRKTNYPTYKASGNVVRYIVWGQI